MTAKIDVIIPGFENLPLLRRCLRAIAKWTPDGDANVIYVDNGTAPYDLGQVMTDYPAMTVIHLPRPAGFVRAVNLGMVLALMQPAPYLMWLNNDTEVGEGWLDALLAPFEHSEKVGAVGAVSDHVYGAQHRDAPLPDGDWVDVPILVGFALAVRKSAAQAVGLLDERFSPGNYEDWDYSLRLREAGYRLIVNEQVWIKHAMHQTFAGLKGFDDLLARNLNLLVGKWGVEKMEQMGIQIRTQEAPESTVAVAPPLDDYAAMMPVIESWETGQAEFLGDLLYDTIRPHRVIDFGCGPGNYLAPFSRHGCEVWGVDAEPTAGARLNGHFLRADLRAPFIAPDVADLALCIEVAEHLQPEYADTLVTTICRNARAVFWSAARPGQGGQYHWNEQPAEYWEGLFAARGFVPHPRQADVQQAIAANAECQKVKWLLWNARLFVKADE